MCGLCGGGPTAAQNKCLRGWFRFWPGSRHEQTTTLSSLPLLRRQSRLPGGRRGTVLQTATGERTEAGRQRSRAGERGAQRAHGVARFLGLDTCEKKTSHHSSAPAATASSPSTLASRPLWQPTAWPGGTRRRPRGAGGQTAWCRSRCLYPPPRGQQPTRPCWPPCPCFTACCPRPHPPGGAACWGWMTWRRGVASTRL